LSKFHILRLLKIQPAEIYCDWFNAIKQTPPTPPSSPLFYYFIFAVRRLLFLIYGGMILSTLGAVTTPHNAYLVQIMLSAYHGHAPLVKLLLQYGADPNRLNDRGQSPLAGAVFKNEREVIPALLEGKADPRLGEPSALDACRVGHENGRN
jgi:hypothetical protein